MPCSSLLYQGQHRLPKKASAFLLPWVGQWALDTGKQPEDIWHGWTAGVPGPGHIGFLLLVTLRGTERFDLALWLLQQWDSGQ